MATSPRKTSRAREVVVDLLVVAGSGLLIYGAWLAAPPAGFVVAGCLMLAAGVKGIHS